MGITLPNPLTVQMGQAVQQAYLAFKQGSQWQPTAPSGWSYTTSITGWDEIISHDGTAELFGLVFQAAADPSQVLIAFRGTDSKVDAYNDLFYFTETFTPYANVTPPIAAAVAKGFNGIYVHTGKTLATSLQAQVFQLLSSISAASSGLSQIYVTGHSLGGAIAELLAYDLSLSLPSTPATTITFAAPMVGIQSWGQAYDAGPGASTIRVVNLDDVVPNLPPLSISPNYVQVAQEFAIQFKGQNEGLHPTEDLIIRHEMDNYLYVIEQAIGQSPQQWAGTFPDGVITLKHGPHKGQPVTDESVIPSA